MNIIDAFVYEYSRVHYGWACVIAFLCFSIYVFTVRRTQRTEGKLVPVRTYVEAFAFGIYIAMILGGTLLNRTAGTQYETEWIPFWSYWDTFVKGDKYLWRQMVYNVIIFVPWGILLPMMLKKERPEKGVIYSAAIFSVAIELCQLLFRCGLFEFDDIFHNTLGAIVGFGLWKLGSKIRAYDVRRKILNSDN